MIAEILPDAVVAVEAWSDPAGIALFAEEQHALGRAVEKRRREFTTARDCAHRALVELGLPLLPVPSGPRGEPRWPAGIVGSITHCRGYRACAAARASDVVTVGIDAEPNEPLPAGVLGAIARAEELPHLHELGQFGPSVCWDRLLFSAKESVYKAWFPLTRRELGFDDAVLAIDPREGSFAARLLVSGSPPAGVGSMLLSGRWLVGHDLILTVVAIESHSRGGAQSPVAG
jgi:4'-phosphopantetheinyl transferase EntD